MMPSKRATLTTLLLTLAFSGFIIEGQLRADVLLEQNFNDVPDGDLATKGSVWQWGGPDGSYGTVKATGDKYAGDQGKSAAFLDIAPQSDKGQGPTLNIDWNNQLPSDPSIKISVEWKLMIPKVGDVNGTCFLGKGWGDALFVINMSKGHMNLVYGNDQYQLLGDYEHGRWYSLKVVLDPAHKTFTFFYNGNRAMTDSEWRKAASANTGFLTIVAQVPKGDPSSGPVLYADDVKVSTP